MKINNLTLRPWQEEAVNRSLTPLNPDGSPNVGIFLEAAGGRGKTIGALAIAQKRGAKSVLILNNRRSILFGEEKKDPETGKKFTEGGWQGALDLFDIPNVELITDRTLSNRLKKGETFDVDVLIIDEWQNMSSKANIKNYKKIKRDYTIGLSATPLRQNGANFYGLEETIFGGAMPANNWMWQLHWGNMVEAPFASQGVKWDSFRDYDAYKNQLPNFMRFETIEQLTDVPVNNGHKIETFRYRLPSANPKLLADFRKYNIVRVDGQSAMSKQHFGQRAFERVLNQAGVSIDSPYLRAVNADTPTLLKVDQLINAARERLEHGLLVVTESKDIAAIIKERHPDADLWTGTNKDIEERKIMIATSQSMGVGVDGLQHRFDAILSLDPVKPDSGRYDDYRQLLWRITGSRQQHDVKILEFYYD